MKKTTKFRPPKIVQRNARIALILRKRHNLKAGTRIGWFRAGQLASGKRVSLEIIKRIAKYNRHRKNAKINRKLFKTPYKDKGYIMWLAWGGNEGISWAKSILRRMKK
jgi:hypothetical protein